MDKPTESALGRCDPSDESLSRERVNILLVDDQRANLLALEGILRNLGQNLVTARSGEEALRHLLHDDFAVILLDVQMPAMDGYETASLIRGRERSHCTPVIFITAYDQPDLSAVKAYSLGAVDYLVKPIVPQILRAKVTGFVELFQKTEQVQRQARQLESANQKLEQEISERRRALGELERSNQELEQFAYVASHDLKEPLRKVRVYLQLLETRLKGRLNEEEEQFLLYAVDGAGRMQHLVTDLLAYARVSSRGAPLGPADAAAAFDQAASHLGEEIQAVNGRVTRGALPTVHANASQLVLVFQNLLGNALKFARDGVAPIAHADACRDGDQWRFTVSDNGIGIDRRYADKIFVIFERLHGPQEYPGTGIGLAICKKIVERHGGSIWVQSGPEQGSTFHFTLPVVPGAPA